MFKKYGKYLLLMIMCSLAILVLCACGGDDSEKEEETTGEKKAEVSTTITVPSDEYNVQVGKTVYIEAELKSDDDSVYLSYESADKAVATVSSFGKITGVAAGTTDITVKSSDGVEKKVSVTVEAVAVYDGLKLALNVMYNDSGAAYFENLVGEAIEVKDNGQYTVVFDFAKDATDGAKAAGITGLNNLTSVYIKDYGVTVGDLTASNLVSCDIKYDKIVVDGTELTITVTDPKNAIKGSGIFDTNDPLNAWDGSAVAEVDADMSTHVLNIKGIENPQKIEVTFTLSNLVFK